MKHGNGIAVVIITCILFPFSAHGAVLINEIAWMGTTVGPNKEWIELYNDGSVSVDLQGWVLSDNVSLDISLTGVIGPGAYAVLERTNDETVAGVAFLIYTGALSNEGRTLTLRRPDGSIEDQIAGGENWGNIGGDNATKDTAQRTSGGWVTGTPTPGALNGAGDTTPESTSDDSGGNQKNTTKSSGGGSSPKTVVIETKEARLVLTLKAPAIAYVNQPVDFKIESTGAGRTVMNSLVYAWNFGDSYTGSGKNPQHTYAYPGEYVVMVEGAFAERRETIRHEVIVLPIHISIARTESGDVLLHNDTKYEVDIGGYILEGRKELVFPENTILKPRGTLTIAASRIEAEAPIPVSLYDREKKKIAPIANDAFTTINTGIVHQALPQTSSLQITEASPKAITDKNYYDESGDKKEQSNIIQIGNAGAAVDASRSMPLKNIGYISLMGAFCGAILLLYVRR